MNVLRLSGTLLAFMIATLTAFSVLAQNKVIVVPMLGDETPTYKTIFVTRGVYSGNLGGPAAADAICQQSADGPRSNVRGKSFKAWISGGLATDHSGNGRVFNRSELPYKMVNGETVAENYEDFIDRNRLLFIEFYASGDFISADSLRYIWTGITADGSYGSDDDDCNGWTDNSSDSEGRVGYTSSFSIGGWTDSGIRSCDQIARLYCFEQ